MSKVLLVEDDPLVSRMYSKSFRFEGVEVTLAKNGKEGLEVAKKIKPDLIYLDIMMPEMNGIEVLGRLKADKETKNIPVVMLTNLSGTHDVETAMTKGASGYMVKSEYKPKEIAKKAKEFLTKLAEGEKK